LIALAALLIFYAGWTLVRSRVWKDNHTLFATDINTSTKSAKLLNAMGGDLITGAEKEKDPEIKSRMLRESQGYLKRAQEIHPNYKLSYLLLGNSHFHLAEYDLAIASYRHILKMDPNYGEGRRNLGVALRELGKIQGEKQNNLVGAITLLEEAVTFIPDDFQTYHLLGVAYGQKGETQKAIDFFKKEIELAPKNATAYYNLGIAYRQAGNDAAANENFDKARELDPDLPQLQNR
jgi:tetratricopeptide (TPR) repeat protein